jgi:hypothetical protein
LALEVSELSFTDEVAKDVTVALKARDTLRTSTLRLLLNALKNKEIELRRVLADDEGVRIVSTQIRQRGESIEQFKRGGRPELAEKEAAEIEILKAYLPPQLSAEEVHAIVKEAAARIKASEMKDMGRLMKEVMSALKGRADGKTVNQAVKLVLTT